MKIAIVTTEYPTEATPLAGAFVQQNARNLAEEHDVTVMHFISSEKDDGTKRLSDGKVNIRRFVNDWQTRHNFETAYNHIVGLSFGFDVIHTMNRHSILPFAFRGGTSKELPCPWIHSEGSSVHTPPNWPADMPPVHTILENADQVTVVADSLLRDLTEKRLSAPLTLIPPLVQAPSDLPERDYTPGRIRLFAAGLVDGNHQPLYAVRTVRLLREQGIDASLLWVGNGPDRMRAQSRAMELDLNGYVGFMAQAPTGSTPVILAQTDVFFLPSGREVACVPAIRALRYGRPVVMGAGGASLGYLDPDVSEVVAEKASEAYAEAVLRVLDKTEGKTAAEIAATLPESYEPYRVMAAYDDLYQHACEKMGRRKPRAEVFV